MGRLRIVELAVSHSLIVLRWLLVVVVGAVFTVVVLIIFRIIHAQCELPKTLSWVVIQRRRSLLPCCCSAR